MEELDLGSMMSQMNQQMSDPAAFKAPGGSDFEKDTRMYSISRNKDGNGSVKIRFLPSLNAEKNRLQTFITQQVHQPEIYKDEKKRFIKEVCPKTIGGRDAKCPICDYAWDGYNGLKDAGLKDSKEAKQFLKFASKERYISNILIIEDTENPSNQGKVFLYEYGAQLQELIKKAMQPTDEEQKEKGLRPFNAWDLMQGKDFRLKLTSGKETSNGFPTWVNSFFSTEASAVVTDEAGMRALLDTTYCLDEFVSPDAISNEEKLMKQLDYVTWKTVGKTKDETPKETKEAELGSIPGMIPQAPAADVPKPQADLGEVPAWMGAGQVAKPLETPPATSASATIEVPKAEVAQPQTTPAVAATKAPTSAEDFLNSLNKMNF